MLAARAHMNLSESILSYLRKNFPQEKKSNKVTLECYARKVKKVKAQIVIPLSECLKSFIRQHRRVGSLKASVFIFSIRSIVFG
jgi:hypothetical protein